MNRIDSMFAELKKQNKKALITFITAGDPDFDTTEQLILEMERQGANLIELGVPFSDPIAEGPIIQEASLRSLQGGTTLEGIFELVKKLRTKTEIPLVFMMYINTIYRFGVERFFSLCQETGIDAVIVPDLPFEEHDEIDECAYAHGVYPINLVAPTSKDRIAAIAANSKGFLYCVSSTGVTGVRNTFQTDFDSFFDTIKQHASIPYCVGFGISSPEQVKQMKTYCDGVIVGSAIVKMIGQEQKSSVATVGTFVKVYEMLWMIFLNKKEQHMLLFFI